MVASVQLHFSCRYGADQPGLNVGRCAGVCTAASFIFKKIVSIMLRPLADRNWINQSACSFRIVSLDFFTRGFPINLHCISITFGDLRETDLIKNGQI